MASRQEVYAAIDDERDYQVRIWQERSQEADKEYRPDSTKAVEEWLIFIQGYFNDAVQDAAHQAGYNQALNVVRKLAALCVACMEAHGAPRRQLPYSMVGTPPIFYGPCARSMVYELIDDERTHQDHLPPTRTDGRKHTVLGYLCMFSTYLRVAIDAWTLNAGDEVALDNIRKLAAICVHCMEDHGAPKRQ